MKKQITVIDMRSSGTERRSLLRRLTDTLRNRFRSIRNALRHTKE